MHTHAKLFWLHPCFYGQTRRERGSLQEQKGAIENYSHRFGLKIDQWFEERETAAKHGRPVFTQMLKLLRQGKARGVIIHKIDRSARNLKDWADLGEMIDAGIEFTSRMKVSICTLVVVDSRPTSRPLLPPSRLVISPNKFVSSLAN